MLPAFGFLLWILYGNPDSSVDDSLPFLKPRGSHLAMGKDTDFCTKGRKFDPNNDFGVTYIWFKF